MRGWGGLLKHCFFIAEVQVSRQFYFHLVRRMQRGGVNGLKVCFCRFFFGFAIASWLAASGIDGTERAQVGGEWE